MNMQQCPITELEATIWQDPVSCNYRYATVWTGPVEITPLAIQRVVSLSLPEKRIFIEQVFGEKSQGTTRIDSALLQRFLGPELQ